MAQESSAEVLNWVREEAIPLKTVQVGSGFDDLQPLKKILGGVRLVGLGEATHGTREFFQCKHRLLEFLAEEMGFTVFAIEASYAACIKINDYVLYGQGDPAAALAGQGFWTWDTEEVVAMIEWMRQYNLGRPAEHKLKFLGYDVQVVDLAIKLVREYMGKVAPERAAETEAVLGPVVESQLYSRSTGGNTDPEKKKQAVDRLHGLIGWLAAHSARLRRMTSPAEHESALQHARVLAQFEESYGKPTNFAELGDIRDLYMAENIEYIAHQLEPHAKIVVWAHNAHIAKNPGAGKERDRMMGHHLEEIFGREYYAFGFSFRQGAFQSRIMEKAPGFTAGPLTEFTVGPAPEGHLDWFLSQARKGDYIVDFRQAPPDGPVRDWLRDTRPMRSVGAGYSKDWTEEERSSSVRPCYFDGMLQIAVTTRARPTPTGVR